jgi:hypothetical protein
VNFTKRTPGWFEKAGRVIDETWADLRIRVWDVFNEPEPEAEPEWDDVPTTGAPTEDRPDGPTGQPKG